MTLIFYGIICFMSREQNILDAGSRPGVEALAERIFIEGAMGEVPGLDVALRNFTTEMHTGLSERLAQMHGRGKEQAPTLDELAKNAGASACNNVDFA